MKRFKIYRWIKGGRWAFIDGEWWPVSPGGLYSPYPAGFLDIPGVSVHFNFLGIKKREDYT